MICLVCKAEFESKTECVCAKCLARMPDLQTKQPAPLPIEQLPGWDANGSPV